MSFFPFGYVWSPPLVSRDAELLNASWREWLIHGPVCCSSCCSYYYCCLGVLGGEGGRTGKDGIEVRL